MENIEDSSLNQPSLCLLSGSLNTTKEKESSCSQCEGSNSGTCDSGSEATNKCDNSMNSAEPKLCQSLTVNIAAQISNLDKTSDEIVSMTNNGQRVDKNILKDDQSVCTTSDLNNLNESSIVLQRVLPDCMASPSKFPAFEKESTKINIDSDLNDNHKPNIPTSVSFKDYSNSLNTSTPNMTLSPKMPNSLKKVCLEHIAKHLPTVEIKSLSSEALLKSDDEFNDPSPVSSEELSLDSGVASLDDQDQQSQSTSGNVTTEKGSVAKGDRKRLRSSLCSGEPHCKRRKSSTSSESTKMVSFSGVTVFYFSRRQSFITVPSQGGSTLGMSLSHNHVKEMSLKQHRKTVLQRRKTMALEQSRQQRISMKLKQLKQTYPNLDTCQLMPMVVQLEPEEESSESSSDSDFCEDDDQADDNYFLQPIPTKKRRLLLRMSGVQRIDSEEKLSNKMTRESREICGCDCTGMCLPESCLCALSGIPCQVDRESFPCGCSAAGCGNANGRVEFDADRVRNHYMRTMRRLRFEETGVTPTLLQPLDPIGPPRPSPYASPSKFELFSQLSPNHSLNQNPSEETPGFAAISLTQHNYSNNNKVNFTEPVASSFYPIQQQQQQVCDDVYQKQDFWGTLHTIQPHQSTQSSFYGHQNQHQIQHHNQYQIIGSEMVAEQQHNGDLQYIEPQPVGLSSSSWENKKICSDPLISAQCPASAEATTSGGSMECCNTTISSLFATFAPQPSTQYTNNPAPNLTLPASIVNSTNEAPTMTRLDPIASFFSQSGADSLHKPLSPIVERRASLENAGLPAHGFEPTTLGISQYCDAAFSHAKAETARCTNLLYQSSEEQLSAPSSSCAIGECNNDTVNVIA